MKTKQLWSVIYEHKITIILLLASYLIFGTLINIGVINRYISNLMVMVLIMIVMATSLNIATGFLGQLVLGHAGFMAIGAYTAALIGLVVQQYTDSAIVIFAISSVAAMVLAGLAGLLVGTPALRLRGDYLGIMTLGFGEIVRNIITNMEITKGAQGLTGIPRIMTFQIAFITTVIIVTIIFLFMNSRHGRAILSIREDEIASESVGINITRYKLLGFVLASMFAGVGGSMFAFKEAFLSPSQFTFIRSVEIFVIVVLGGMGSLSGSMISALILVFLPEYLRDFEQYRLLIYSMLLVVMMLFRPQGLMGTKEFELEDLEHWKAIGKKILSIVTFQYLRKGGEDV